MLKCLYCQNVLWWFSREDYAYRLAFFIDSHTRSIEVSTSQFNGFVHKTILTLSVGQYQSLQDFYVSHQDTLMAIEMYEHAWRNCDGRQERILQNLSPRSIQLLSQHDILDADGILEESVLEIPVVAESMRPETGWVYLMGDAALLRHPKQVIKIGYSKNPVVREQTLQAEKPSIELITAWRGTRRDEKVLHEQFTDRRLRGEWFELGPADIDVIKATFQEREVWNGAS